MNDKEFKRIKRVIEKALKKWVKILGLSQWEIKTDIRRELCDSEPDTLALVYPRWEYQHATIECFAVCMGDKSDKEIEGSILHELTHCLVNELRQIGDTKEKIEESIKHEERVVTMITNALGCSFEAGYLNGMKGIVNE